MATALYDNQPIPYVEARKVRVEHVVVRQLEALFEEFGVICNSQDRVLEAGCSKKRPDLVMLSDEAVVVVEVDEHQHRLYDKECEDSRMHIVKQDIACAYMPDNGAALPVIFIRFNPHKCKGPRNADKLNTRVEKLAKRIKDAFKMKEDTLLYMYYDSYSNERKGFFSE